MNMSNKPIIALAMGDPAGISPELTAKAIALDEVRHAARLVVVGDRRIFDEGARVAQCAPDVEMVRRAVKEFLTTPRTTRQAPAIARPSSILRIPIQRRSSAASRAPRGADRRSPIIV